VVIEHISFVIEHFALADSIHNLWSFSSDPCTFLPGHLQVVIVLLDVLHVQGVYTYSAITFLSVCKVTQAWRTDHLIVICSCQDIVAGTMILTCSHVKRAVHATRTTSYKFRHKVLANWYRVVCWWLPLLARRLFLWMFLGVEFMQGFLSIVSRFCSWTVVDRAQRLPLLLLWSRIWSISKRHCWAFLSVLSLNRATPASFRRIKCSISH